MTTGPYTDIDFVLSGSNGRGDFIGISGSALDKAGIGVFTCESGSVNFLSKSAGTMLNVYNGPYQYASWQQTRNLYNPIVRKLVENSILSLSDTTVPVGNGLNQVRAQHGGVTCYKEPVVSDNAKPINHVLEVQPNINEPTITTSSFTYTYENNLSSFTNVAIRNHVGIDDNDEASMYKNISELYLDLEEVDSDTNPVQKFIKLDYSQILYPSPLNAFLNRTRDRTNYAEVSGRSSNGYDRIFGTQRTFFKTLTANTKPFMAAKTGSIRTFGEGKNDAKNSQGYGPAPISGSDSLQDSLNFNPMATDGLRSYPNSGSYRNCDGELMMDTEISMIRYKPVPSLAFNELNYITNASASVTASSGYVERLTEQISGRNPWYDTYDQYDLDVRPDHKDMSILPEFRISEFMDYYINEQGNNFRAPNAKFLLLDGASVTASAPAESSSVDSSFISKYVESSKIEKLKGIIEEHKDVARVDHIELSCYGVKKLLPYDGFYPANRTVQLGNLLSQSMGAHIVGRKRSNPDGLDDAGDFVPQGLQALLKPLVSPGILYNSIKSGIAVDYPIYTGSAPGVITEDTESPSEFRLNVAPDYRLPFESLINLEETLPINPGVMDTDSGIPLSEVQESQAKGAIHLVSSFVTASFSGQVSDVLQYKFYWDGNKKPLFELGMHNFLAETVDFFLEGDSSGGKLSSFRSAPQPSDGWELEADKTYYMDVRLSDTVEMNKFAEYSGVKTHNENLWLYSNPPEAGADFGAKVKLLSSSAGQYCLSSAGGLVPRSLYLFRRKRDGFGWLQLMKIEQGDLDHTFKMYDPDIDFVSASDGFRIIVGGWQTPSLTTGGSWAGRAYLIHTTETEIISKTMLTASNQETDGWFGRSVAILSGSDRYWFAVGAPGMNDVGNGNVGNVGCVYIYNSSSHDSLPGLPDIEAPAFGINSQLPVESQYYQTRLTGGTSQGDMRLGYSVSMVSGGGADYGDHAGHIWVLAGAYQAAGTKAGSASLWTVGPSESPSTDTYPYGSDAKLTYCSLTASDANQWLKPVAPGYDTYREHFGGRDVSIASSSHGLYTAIYAFTGANGTAPNEYELDGVPGRVYVYRFDAGSIPPFSASTGSPLAPDSPAEPDKTWILQTDDNGDNYVNPWLGYRNDMVSGTEEQGLYVATAIANGAADRHPQPSIWQLKAGPAGTPAGLSAVSHSLTFLETPAGEVPLSAWDYGAGINMVSGPIDLDVVVGCYNGDVTVDETTVANSGFAVLHSGTIIPESWTNHGASDPKFITSASFTDRDYKYKQHGKLFGLAIEESFPITTTPVGSYDPAYCAYTPPYFYGDSKARISFTPPLDDTYSLDEILAGAKVEYLLDTKVDRMAVINGSVASLTPLQQKVKMALGASVNLFGITKIPGTTTTPEGETMTVDSTPDDPDAWVISTRFECPVIDTKNPKYDELYTAHNPLITGTYGWQSTLVPEYVTQTDGLPAGVTLEPGSQTVWWTDQGAGFIYKANYDGSGKTSMFPVGAPYPRNIQVDAENGKVYWTFWNGATDTGLFYANMTAGSAATEVQLGIASADQCNGLALDVPRGYVYYTLHGTSTEGIYRRDLNDLEGDATPILLMGGVVGLREIALDPVDNKIYYATYGPGPATALQIRRCNALDGSNDELVVPEKTCWSTSATIYLGVAIDPEQRKLYYTVYDGSNVCQGIYVCDLDGTNEENLVDLGGTLLAPYSTEVDSERGLMFWINVAYAPDGAIYKAFKNLHTEHNPRTMWTSYGKVPTGDKGIKLQLAESFPDNPGIDSGSLLQACGFTAGQREVGLVRETKDISEAVVVIPYLDSARSQEEPTSLEGTTLESKSLTVSYVDGKHFIKIPDFLFRKQKENIETLGAAVPANQNMINSGTLISNTTITNMIQKMKRYVMPPNLDFVKYWNPDPTVETQSIEPFVAYIFEFNHTLKRDELTDIWQGVMPDSALKMENDEITISHNIGPYEFFGNILDQKMFGDMKFFVFKVKKKAKQNYYKITEDANDDVRYKFLFANDGSDTAVPPQGSYNWPYDFFSLVEKAKVQAKFILKNKG